MRKFLLYSSALVGLGLSGGAANAACIQTPTCSSLGYSSTSSCEGGTKCPFGEAWNCTASENKNKITELENKIKKIEKENLLRSCNLGEIVYSDWTCSSDAIANKTAIGIIVYTNGKGHGQIMALNSLDGKYIWGTNKADILDLPTYDTKEAASSDYASCENSKKIISVGDKNTYPAAWAAHEYSTEGTTAGEWCLPAAGIFSFYKNNKTTINAGFTKAGGKKISTNTWSSSESNVCTVYDNVFCAWYSHIELSYGLNKDGKGLNLEVRPVLEY